MGKPKRFSASSAARFMACPGSANLELAIPGWVDPVRDDEAGAKGRGSIMHDILHSVSDLTPKEMEGMIEAMDYVLTLRRRRRFKMVAEETLVADWLPSKPKTTVDLALYTQDELHVVDYKTGAIEVQAYQNDQLMFYARTLLHLAPKAKAIGLHILQPWAKTGSSLAVVTRKELLDWADKAIEAEQKITAGDTTLNPSDHCTFCPANPHSRGDKGSPLCPAMMQKLYPMEADEAAILAL